MYNTEAFIKLHNVEIDYSNEKSKVNICKDINLKLFPGEIVGIIGPNGSGKSTLVNAILKQISYKGNIEFIGFNNNQPRIAYIPQNIKDSFFSWTTLRNNILFTEQQFWKKRTILKAKIEELKEELNIDFSLKLKPNECSGGMLQQAAILRALSSHQGILIADEPFSALDIKISGFIQDVFRKKIIEEKIVCLVILHNLDDVLNICDKVIVIPNKPYTTSTDMKNYYEIKQYINNHIDEVKSKDIELTDVVEKILK